MRHTAVHIRALFAIILCVLAGCGTTGSSTGGRICELVATPMEEYYVGRAIASAIVTKYDTFEDEKTNHYLNLIGQLLAQASDRPETFSGYRFKILDTDELNAFASPGGMIFVTRGLLRCCHNEDSVAAVLAHEIGHVQAQHGLRMVERMRALRGYRRSRLGSTVSSTMPQQDSRKSLAFMILLATTFETTIGDLTHVLFTSGYSRQYEYEADSAAAEIMSRVGYDPRALQSILAVLQSQKEKHPGGLISTHPDPEQRIEKVSPVVAAFEPPTISNMRQTRYEEALHGI